MRILFLAILSLSLLEGCSANSDQTNRAYNALGRGHHLNLKSEGYIIGIEKYDRRDIAGPEPGKYKRFRELPNPTKDKLIREQNEEYRCATKDSKSMVITHITSYFPKRHYLYNAYEENLKGKIVYEDGYTALEKFQKDLLTRIQSANSQHTPYSHIVVMNMGWNNDQHVSIYRYNKVLANICEIAGKKCSVTFRPLVIGITWPSAWFTIEDSWLKKKVIGHIGSYTNKSNDSDEIGYTIANWLINYQLPRVRDKIGKENFPKVIAMGHSMGARILSREIFSRDHLKDLPPSPDGTDHPTNVDMFISLQGAFSARRFVEKDSGEGAPYKDFASLPTIIVLTSSENDKANNMAFWSKHVGGGKGLKYMEKKTDTFKVVAWPEKREQVGDAIKAYKDSGRIITLDASSIVVMEDKSDAHNDILDVEMAELIWFCLEQID